MCLRKINNDKKTKCLPCKSCNLLVHRRCTLLPPSTLNSLTNNDRENWECPNCQSDKFPFAEVSSKEIVSLSFNSNYKCPCTNQIVSVAPGTRNLYRLDLCKRNHDKFYVGSDPLAEIEESLRLDTHFDYYEDHEFHKLAIREKFSKTASFSLYHTNIQSIHNKIETLHQSLVNLGHIFDVIALSETWTDSAQKRCYCIGNLSGYNKFMPTYGNSLKGGCGFYVKIGLKVIERKELDTSFVDERNEYEAKWIEIVNEKSKNILIGVCYRHPRKNSDESFNTYLQTILGKTNKKNLLTFVTGDFNYNLLNSDTDKHAASFLETMSINRYQPCILEPTRLVFGNKPTLIDNIFINSLEKDVFCGNLMSKLSDHLPQFILVKDIMKKPKKRCRLIKDYSNFCEEAYKADLRKIYINPIHYRNVYLMFTEFQKQYLAVISKHVPMKKLSIKSFTWKQKPWITSDIQSLIKKKNTCNAKFVRTKHPFWHERFKMLNKEVQKVLFTSKQNYFKKYFAENLNNLRKIWAGLNDLISQKKKQNMEDIFLNDSDGIKTDQKNVANSFNKYFTNVANDLISRLGEPNTEHQDYLKNPNQHSIFLNEIEPDEVRKVISGLDIHKSGDIYGITPYLLKTGCEELVSTLTLLFNITFREGCFPTVLKSAKIVYQSIKENPKCALTTTDQYHYYLF